MKCPKCRTDNPETQRFCGGCGTQLTSFEKPEISVTRTLETGVDELGRGTTFAGRYEIIEELGAGGMGRVYRAFDKKLQEDVALKLIRPDIGADRKTTERFRNEIKIARKIRHTNVCGVYDFHEEGKTLYLTMEYVRGEDLRSLIHRMKSLPMGTAVSISRQIAEGLSEAHKLGIVHRDLKPGNIMIDKDGQAKIMDFGIARSLLGKGLTGEGAIVGTPEYMSPEQVEGKEADQRSDIYALGIILYEMLIGRPPFEGETPFSIANKHKTELPPVPKKIIPQIPDELNKLILRCLEKDKAKRYQSAEELVADLSAVEQSLPTTDRALTRARTKIRTSREITVKLTPKKLIIPAAIVVVIAVAIVAALILFKARLGKIDSLAVLPLEDLSTKKGEGYSVDGIHDALINEMSKIPSVNIIARQNVLRFRDSQKTIPEIARELKVAGIVQGSVLQTKDTVRITIKLFDGQTGNLTWGPKVFDRNPADILSLYGEVTLTIAREINAQLAAKNIDNISQKYKVKPEAYGLFFQASLLLERSASTATEAELNIKKALDLLQRSIQIDPDFALGYAWLARTYLTMGTSGLIPGDEAHKKAKEAAMKSISLNDSLPEAHTVLGMIKFNFEWDFEGAKKEYERAMTLGPIAFRAAVIDYLTLVGRFDEALDLHKKVMEANPLYPDYPNLLWIYFTARRFDEAIAAANKALELNLDVSYVRSLRSQCYAFKKMCAEALAETEKILKESVPPRSTVDVLNANKETLMAMAINYAMCGERKKAEELIVLLKSIPNLGPGYLGWIYPALGEKDLAIADLEKAVAERSPNMLWLKTDPELDPLRDDPRFIALLKKVGFNK